MESLFDIDERHLYSGFTSKTISLIVGAKAFDVMGIIFGILTITYVMLKYNLLIILLAVVAYLLISIVYMAYFTKYHKEINF